MQSFSRHCHRIFRPASRYLSLEVNRTARPLILGIETSCDDTGVAVCNETGILGEALASQMNDHLRFGGIIPPVAADLHRRNIEAVTAKALAGAQLSVSDVDAIAVTNRPGLQLSLFVGLRYAKHLARKFAKPLIPIHHMEAHALTIRMMKPVQFPFLCLLVSGGHSLLTVVQSVDKFLLLGHTIDDAPGECFDKVARRLKLRHLKGYENLSGGQAIELAAKGAKGSNYYFPLPLAKQRDCEFSFAGLKNPAMRHILREERETDTAMDSVMPGYEDFCACFLKAVTRHLAHRTQRAMEFCVEEGLLSDRQQKTLVVSGGVACNNFIFNVLQQLGEQTGFEVVRPTSNLCTDNGVMIAWNGVERYKIGSNVFNEAQFEDITAIGRCPLGEDWISKVRDKNMKCQWVKLPMLL